MLSFYPKCSILISDLHLLSNKKTRVQGGSCNLGFKVRLSPDMIVLKKTPPSTFKHLAVALYVIMTVDSSGVYFFL